MVYAPKRLYSLVFFSILAISALLWMYLALHLPNLRYLGLFCVLIAGLVGVELGLRRLLARKNERVGQSDRIVVLVMGLVFIACWYFVAVYVWPGTH